MLVPWSLSLFSLSNRFVQSKYARGPLLTAAQRVSWTETLETVSDAEYCDGWLFGSDADGGDGSNNVMGSMEDSELDEDSALSRSADNIFVMMEDILSSITTLIAVILSVEQKGELTYFFVS